MRHFYLTGILMLSCIMFNCCNNASAKSTSEESVPVITNENSRKIMTTSDENSFVDANTGTQTGETTSTTTAANDDTKIQVALLLDTSGSMDGLIEQAKSRLWNIVNTLTTLRFQGKTPEIQIALYEYGNDNIKASEGYVRLVTPLTIDLDLVSEKLFALKTNGGLEYCGTVIDRATNNLKWSTNESDIHLIYIAGNEEFTQGGISYKEAISGALRKNITVNTIHCGNRDDGISGKWKDGADKGNGKFFNINHNARVRYVATPYDDRIDQCNIRLNATYISYGREGEARKINQAAQDKNAESISSANKAERVVSKTRSVYKNGSWDLIDLVTENEKALSDIKQSELPKELQGKSEAEVKLYVVKMKGERESIQKEIEALAKERQAYIDKELKKDGEASGDDLGKLINLSVIEYATAKGYKTE